MSVRSLFVLRGPNGWLQGTLYNSYNLLFRLFTTDYYSKRLGRETCKIYLQGIRVRATISCQYCRSVAGIFDCFWRKVKTWMSTAQVQVYSWNGVNKGVSRCYSDILQRLCLGKTEKRTDAFLDTLWTLDWLYIYSWSKKPLGLPEEDHLSLCWCQYLSY